MQKPLLQTYKRKGFFVVFFPRGNYYCALTNIKSQTVLLQILGHKHIFYKIKKATVSLFFQTLNF